MAQCCVAIFHDLRHCRCRASRCSGCGVSIDHGRLRPDELGCSDCRLFALAADVRVDHSRSGLALPLWTKPPPSQVALDKRRQCLRCADMACRFLAVFLVPRQFRQLQCDLWSARRGGEVDDVDVAIDHRGAGGRRAQFCNRSTRPRGIRPSAPTSRSAPAAPSWRTRWGRQRREAPEPAEVLRYTTDGYEINRVPVYKGPLGPLSWQPRQEGSMDTTTLLIILIVVLILFGGGWYGRGLWFLGGLRRGAPPVG